MSYKEKETLVSMEAGQDLSANQFHFVTVASDEQVDPTGDGLFANGVLQNDPNTAGHAAVVAIGGVTQVKAGGSVTAGDAVASDASGKAVTAASGDVILGTALETAGADGDIIAIHFHPRGNA